jgi:hypothetical protein
MDKKEMRKKAIDDLIKEIEKPIISFGLEAVYDSLMKMSYWIMLIYILSEGVKDGR